MYENQIVRGFWFHQRGFLRNDNFFCTSLGCLNPSFEKEEKEETFWERAQVRRRRTGETTPSCPTETRGFRHFWWLCGCLSPLWEFLAGKLLFPLIPMFCCEIGSSSAAAVRHAALRLLSVLCWVVEFLFFSYCCFFCYLALLCRVHAHICMMGCVKRNKPQTVVKCCRRHATAVLDQMADGGQCPASSLTLSAWTFPLCCL